VTEPGPPPEAGRGPAFAEDAWPPAQPADEQFVVEVAGYEGPLDALLALAREQKVDLAHISILALANQFLAFVERAKQLRIELAADYLVMAAWLAYLKSRLLVPEPAVQEEGGLTGAELADALAFQLRRAEALRAAAASLGALPRLGADVFPKGLPPEAGGEQRGQPEAALVELLSCYAALVRKAPPPGVLVVPAPRLWSVDEALRRLERLLPRSPSWVPIETLLPEDPPEGRDPTLARSALAATFVAGLEMARDGRADVMQESAFSQVYFRAGRALARGGGQLAEGGPPA
jgi:segregation and condensation protein A